MSTPAGAPVEEPDFDVIVVGAGPAGSVTACLLARAGHSVVLIERGEAPGSKNLSGGVLYGRVLDEVFPGFVDQAPVERRITRNVVTFLTPDSTVSMDLASERLAHPVNAVTVLRARFDLWLAEQAEADGAFVMPGVRVEEVLTRDGVVTGVRAGDDELHARVVVAADGVNSFVARSAGIREAARPEQLAVGVKAVLRLPREKIEDRFGIGADEGAAHALVGDCTQGVGGGGFLYTNRDSLSVGVVLQLADLARRGHSAADVFDHYLEHPQLERYLAGAELIEYGSHLVAEGGLGMLGQIVTDGMVVVGDAAGLTINSGLTVRGMDLAIGSAIAAAGAVDAALRSGDVSASALGDYRTRLFDSFVGKDLSLYAKAPSFLERPRLYQGYASVMEEILVGAFDLDTSPRRHLRTLAWDAVRHSPVRLRDLASDVYAGMRAL